jgi:hypothetical protein
MGMAASQARFLGLTARKTNTEFEGQQVNQQRTMLANKSANYYNDLLGMTVPTPPSVDDYTKTVYSFNDGALENTVNSLIAQADGQFLISYTRTWKDDNAVVAASSSIVTRAGSAGSYVYSVGAKELRSMGSITGYDVDNDEYLSSLSKDQLNALLDEENKYVEQLQSKYGNTKSDWYVIYKQDTTTKEWLPVFYDKYDLEKSTAKFSDVTGSSQSFIPAYTTGSTTVRDEVKGVKAMLEKDSSGRYINITLFDADGNGTTYSLTTSTTTDQAAYNDAVNQYEYNKAQYDKSVQDINSKIEIIQAEDRSLELRLKQLDTEQKAIQTEMEAVTKVIEKNTQDTFKTFSG